MRIYSGLNLVLVFLPRTLRKAIFLFGVAVTLWFGTSPDCRAARPHRDYLVPVTKPLGSRAAYEELWQQKLLVTSGEIARFVGLPGTEGVETTVSVYRAPGKEGSLPGDYWMTATQASESLWNCVEPGTKGQADPNAIAVERCDAPIPESTALTVHKSWLTMLSQSRPQHDSRVIPVDSSREIFSAVDAEGRILQGESPTAPKKNTKALINIALSLLEYCGADASKRSTIASDIERAAWNLLGRASNSGTNSDIREHETARGQKQRSDASIKRAPTSGTLALISNTTEQRPNHVPSDNPAPQRRDVIDQLSTEQRIVGAWSWTYIEGVGRIIFTSDHKVRIGFPPTLKDGRKIGDHEFDIVQSGVWRVDGDALITEIDNTPLIKIIEQLDPSNIPALEKTVERRRIVKIDSKEIVFDDGSSFQRVKR